MTRIHYTFYYFQIQFSMDTFLCFFQFSTKLLNLDQFNIYLLIKLHNSKHLIVLLPFFIYLIMLINWELFLLSIIESHILHLLLLKVLMLDS